MRRVAAGVGLAIIALSSVACGTSTTVDVYAASSLTELMHELGDTFEKQNDGAELRFNFASSSALATQVRQGAPADLYASANPALADALTEDGYVAHSQVIASTQMVVVVQAKNDSINMLAQLADPGIILVLASEGVPAGDYARQLLANASTADALGEQFHDQVLANVRSFEPNVRATLLKVELGEADAAIVYQTDVQPGNTRLRTVAIPDEYNVTARFVVALLNDADAPARAFYDFLATDTAAGIIREFGFEAAGSPR